jgi:transglutaminase-like putative cysteine protease
MASHTSTRLVGLLALFLLIANLYVFFTREWESSFTPTSYATLYYPLDIPTIRSWHVPQVDRIQLDIACTTPVDRWSVYTDGEQPQTALGMNPSFGIDTTFSELHTYRLVPEPKEACQPITITIQCYSGAFYKQRGMHHTDAYIVRADVPCGEFEQYPVASWVDDYAYVGEEGLLEVDRVLRDEVGITPGESTFARMEKLMRFLRIRLKDAGGVPLDNERWMNPLDLYHAMVDGSGKGWCTQNAQIWVFWANRAGIATRFVFGARTEADNHIVYTGHSWGESFIPEQNRWAFVDLAHAQTYITDRNGLVLNSAELFHLNQHNAFDSVFARIYVDREWQKLPGMTGTDTLVTVPYTLCNGVVRNEFTSHSILKYRRPPNVEDVRAIYTGFLEDRTFLMGNLERYLFKPQLAYSFYPTEGAHTYAVRRILFFGFLAFLAAWLWLRFRKRHA